MVAGRADLHGTDCDGGAVIAHGTARTSERASARAQQAASPEKGGPVAGAPLRPLPTE